MTKLEHSILLVLAIVGALAIVSQIADLIGAL